ncbi:MAG: stage 0 sporulation family protein [Eubacterium sp.]|nr:stage 0 sporulation family protein [Eubacterium sp.]
MKTVVGVRFRQVGRVYYFDPGEEKLARGQRVIVSTQKGTEIGTVILPNTEMDEDKLKDNVKKIIRIATEKDEQTERENREKEKEAFDICKTKIERHGLEMKLIGAEYTFDRNKLLFFFTADGRVDFRELVKDLAGVFRTRIELRQIGVRDETKICGGIGICGRALCCSSYLTEFAPVSIKMAKEQSLSLNPTKISGVCGRLMCCLKNEEAAYEELNSHLPNVGDRVKTSDGLEGEVQSVSVLKQRVKVIVELEGDEKEVRDYEVKELTFQKYKPKRDKDKDKDKEKDKERDKNHDKDHDNNRDKDRDKDRDNNNRDKDRSKGRGRNRGRNRGKDRGKDTKEE